MAIAKSCDVAPDELVSAAMARDLEVITAERDGAVRIVAHLVKLLEQQGGYLSPEDQLALHDGRELAERAGLRKPRHVTPWLGK